MRREVRHFSTDTPFKALCGYVNSLDSGHALTSRAPTVNCRECLRLRAEDPSGISAQGFHGHMRAVRRMIAEGAAS